MRSPGSVPDNLQPAAWVCGLSPGTPHSSESGSPRRARSIVTRTSVDAVTASGTAEERTPSAEADDCRRLPHDLGETGARASRGLRPEAVQIAVTCETAHVVAAADLTPPKAPQ